MDRQSPEMLKPAMIAGAGIGVLGGVPFISVCCCLWMTGAGILAAYLYSKKCSEAGVEFRAGQGALLGLLTAPFYALVAALLGGVFSMMIGGPDVDAIAEALEQAELEEELAQKILSFVESMGGFLGVIIGFFVQLVMAAVLTTLGGLIGGTAFRVEPTAPAAPVGSSSLGGGSPEI